jgi:hypothetical protein
MQHRAGDSQNGAFLAEARLPRDAVNAAGTGAEAAVLVWVSHLFLPRTTRTITNIEEFYHKLTYLFDPFALVRVVRG